MIFRAIIAIVAVTLMPIQAAANTASLPIKLTNVTPEQMMYALGVHKQDFDHDLDAYVAAESRSTYPKKEALSELSAPVLPAGIEVITPVRFSNGLLVRGESQAVEELTKRISALDVTPQHDLIKDEFFDLTNAEAEEFGLPSATDDGPVIKAIPVGLMTWKKLYELRGRQPNKTVDRPIVATISGQPASVFGRAGGIARVFALPCVNADKTLTVYLRAQACAWGEESLEYSPMLALKRHIYDRGSIFLALSGTGSDKATLVALTFVTLGSRPKTTPTANEEQGRGSSTTSFSFPRFR